MIFNIEDLRELTTIIRDAMPGNGNKLSLTTTKEDIVIWITKALTKYIQIEDIVTAVPIAVEEVTSVRTEKYPSYADVMLDHSNINTISKPIIKFKPVNGLSITEFTDKFMPTYSTEFTEFAAAFDCRAYVDTTYDLMPNERVTIGLGFHCELPEGYKLSIKPRSGLAAKYGITIVNSPGTIDCDYRGEVKVILLNTGSEPFTINPGDRICQAELEHYTQATFEVVDELNVTKRGEGGFGSTGNK